LAPGCVARFLHMLHALTAAQQSKALTNDAF
jgi:hypothetical protein